MGRRPGIGVRCVLAGLLTGSAVWGADAGAPDSGVADAAPAAPDASSPGDAGADAASQGEGGGDAATATCRLSTGYAGDDRCLVPPAPGEGFALHFGPASYDDPTLVVPFVLAPGEEFVRCVFLHTPNDAPVFVRKATLGARATAVYTGVWLLPGDVPDSTGAGPCDPIVGSAVQLFAASVTPADVAVTSAAPENAALAWQIPAHAPVAVRMHSANITDTATLQESWANLWTTSDPGMVAAQPLNLRGNAIIPPRAAWLTRFRCDVPGPLRIVRLSGAVGASDAVQRLSAYLVRASGERTLIYQSAGESSPSVVDYDTVTANSPPAGPGSSGAVSGPLSAGVGDAIEWECDAQNVTDVSFSYGPPGSPAACELRGVLESDAPFSCVSAAGVPGADGGVVGLPGSGGLGGGGGAGPDASAGGAGGASGGSSGGASGSGASGGVEAGVGAEAGTGAPGATADDGGCGCRVSAGTPARDMRLLGVALALGALVSRRRRRVASPESARTPAP